MDRYSKAGSSSQTAPGSRVCFRAVAPKIERTKLLSIVTTGVRRPSQSEDILVLARDGPRRDVSTVDRTKSVGHLVIEGKSISRIEFLK
jgi:hypothetical protein